MDIIPAVSVTGAQWGDEAKAKVSDAINEDADIVAKFQGGNNAGNTVVDDLGRERILHYLSTGVVRGKRSLIAPGVVLNPAALVEEIVDLGREVNLGIDPRTPVIFPYHISMDMAQEFARAEKAKGSNNKTSKGAIGTTHKGIGPCYMDDVGRGNSVRFFELVSGSKGVRDKITRVFGEYKNKIENDLGFRMVTPKGGAFGAKELPYTLDEMLDNYMALGKELKRFETDVSREIIDALQKDKNVLFQGSQGILLDYRWGNFPKVTSSHPNPGAIPTCTGVPLPLLKGMESFGVLKAYLTKVGSGPVATCLDKHNWPVDESVSEPEATHIRAVGHEYGATTKRARRVGWLDLPALAYGCEVSGLTQLALTKLDVLAGLKTIKVAYAYEQDGKEFGDYKCWDLEGLDRCEPVYAELPGFTSEEINNAKTFEQLPKGARNLVHMVENATNVPVTLISVGPKRHETIYREGFKSF